MSEEAAAERRGPSTRDSDRLHAALSRLRRAVPALADELRLIPPSELNTWELALDTRLLPRLSPDFPVLAAIAGGGSSGKSTLFNSLLGKSLSPVGGRAGLNRRVLAAVHPKQLERPTFLEELFRPFGAPPVPMRESAELTEPGLPLYVANGALPEGVVLMDTPDFDVGAGGAYLNREVAEPVLAAADVLVYLFTNATYNTKANTDFVREQLTRIGQRPAVLVYRVYQSFSPEEVLEHAETVAQNLYGPSWRDWILAVYRADDTNEVAAGQARAALQPVAGGSTSLLELLAGLDPRTMRAAQHERLVADVGSLAHKVLRQAEDALTELALYRDTVRLAESHASAAALEHLPLDQVLLHVRQAFERTSGGFVRFARAAGRVVGAPVRGLAKLMGRRKPGEAGPARDPVALTQNALVEAANQLRRTVLAEEVAVTTTSEDPDGRALLDRIAEFRQSRRLTGTERPFSEPAEPAPAFNLIVRAHPAADGARHALMQRPFKSALEPMTAAAPELLRVPQEVDAELVKIVDKFREDMGFVQRLREAGMAALNLLPPLVAVVWVFATADPVGASTVAGKLHGLFGLNDLWATVSIPASASLDESTRRDLERLLTPAVRQWLQSRAEPVRSLLREQVSGGVLAEVVERYERAEAKAVEVGEALGVLK